MAFKPDNPAQERIVEDDVEFTILPPPDEKRTKQIIIKGGPGSGHYGHSGRPGKRGGSLPGVGFTRGSVPDGTGLTANGNDARLDKWFNAVAAVHGAAIDDPQVAAAYNQAKALGLEVGTQEYKDFAVTMAKQHEWNVNQRTAFHTAMKTSATDIEWGIATYDARGGVKNKLVTDISEQSGLPYDEVNAAVKQWSHTSNDNSPESLNLQKAVSDEFGVEMSQWQQGKMSYFDKKYGHLSSEERRVTNINNWSDNQQRTFVRTMYSNTQKQLRAAGIGPNDKVTLYRGYSPGGASFSTGEHVSYTGNAAESWSLSPQVASQFGSGIGGIVIKTQVEARNILGTALTGWGCLTEGEVVMFGSTGHDVEVHRGNN